MISIVISTLLLIKESIYNKVKRVYKSSNKAYLLITIRYNIYRIYYLFSIRIELDYIVLRRIYLDIEKLLASSLRAPNQAAIK